MINVLDASLCSDSYGFEQSTGSLFIVTRHFSTGKFAECKSGWNEKLLILLTVFLIELRQCPFESCSGTQSRKYIDTQANTETYMHIHTCDEFMYICVLYIIVNTELHSCILIIWSHQFFSNVSGYFKEKYTN